MAKIQSRVLQVNWVKRCAIKHSFITDISLCDSETITLCCTSIKFLLVHCLGQRWWHLHFVTVGKAQWHNTRVGEGHADVHFVDGFF